MRIGLQSGVLPYRYALVPWVWDTSQAGRHHWRLPASSVGGIDLRPLAAQALAGGAPQGFAFCTSLQAVSGNAIATVPHMSEANVTSGMQDAWQSTTGYRPQGAKLVDLLADQLTTGSDPDGISGPKPLMPGIDGVLRISVPGHSQVWSRRFRFGSDPHTGNVRDLLRRDFERQWEESNGHDNCLRCLDFTCKKYGVEDWKEFVPPRLHSHVPGRLPHATTISDNMDRADSAVLIGNQLGWTQISGIWGTENNRGYRSTGVANEDDVVRADSDLSSDDHYSQAVQYYPTSATYQGPACRIPGTATSTFYANLTQTGDNTIYSTKVVTGSQTILANASQTASGGTTSKVQSDGSTIKTFYGGSEKTSVTDTAITGNVRCGQTVGFGAATLGQFDSFEAADVAVAGVAKDLLRSNLLRSRLLKGLAV